MSQAALAPLAFGDPVLIQQELDLRLAAARNSDPTRKRERSLLRELAQLGKGIERLLTPEQKPDFQTCASFTTTLLTDWGTGVPRVPPPLLHA
jgi:hypothetical protein